MIKVRKLNEVYLISKDHLAKYERSGFVVVKKNVKPKEEAKETILDITPEKPVGNMTKEELIAFATERGFTLTGEEKINDLRRIVK